MDHLFKNKIWITWEDHRRTKELATALNVDLILVKSSLPNSISYIQKIYFTIKIILIRKPDILIVQNPSLLLAFLGSILKKLFNYKYVVDRHTNFRIGKKIGINPINIIKILISKISIHFADVTIVTNEYLKILIEVNGGNAIVLPDKTPSIKNCKKINLIGKENIVFICTYADDEPFKEVIDTAKYLPKDIMIYITGKYKGKIEKENLPTNVILTGFVNKEEYENLIAAADILMDFTKLDWCLVCGGYEAISLEKPLITSSTVALKRFYGNTVLYSDHSPEDLLIKIKYAIKNKEMLAMRMKSFKGEYQTLWNEKFKLIKNEILNA